MIHPSAFARFEDRATLTRVNNPAPTSRALQAPAIRQIVRLPVATEKKETLTQIILQPVITPAGTATVDPVSSWPAINQIGPARQFGIVASRRSLNLKNSAVLRQVFEPFSYIRVVPPTPPLPPSIDGGGFDDNHSRVLDGGQFGEENQPITDGGSW